MSKKLSNLNSSSPVAFKNKSRNQSMYQVGGGGRDSAGANYNKYLPIGYSTANKDQGNLRGAHLDHNIDNITDD